jgi:L-gulono-1,4-lactone dehydrogenase
VTDVAQLTDVIATGSSWRNWGRSQAARPTYIARARSVDDVVDVVRFAADRGLRVKAIGAGHSFSGIAVPEDIQLDISAIDGLFAVDGNLVTLGAGTNLYQLPALLDPIGLALQNMGDIDRQTIAGATSTGTHGTGAAFAGLAAQLRAVTLVTAAGDLLHVSPTENAELWPAARLGLGALGILVDVTVECVPSFLLHAVEKPEPLDDVLDNWLERAASVDHFEFYWFPHTKTALTKTNTRLPLDAGEKPESGFSRWMEEQFMSNGVYQLTNSLSRAIPALVKPINRLTEKVVGSRDFTELSHRVFVAPRTVHFKEMEYAIPREHIPAALRAIDALIENRGWRISFPVEVRAAAADDILLSTGVGRDTGYIAVHRYHRDDPTEYFAEVEQIMMSFQGRPHWGKMHFRDSDSLRPVYPGFDEFVRIRDVVDPERRFANVYLDRVLGR